MKIKLLYSKSSNTFIALRLILLLLSFYSASAYAYVETHENLTLSSGDTKTLVLPDPAEGYIDYSKWTCDNSAIVILSQTTGTAYIKVKKAFSGTATIECLYVTKWYNSQGHIQQITYLRSYYIKCKDAPSEKVSPTSVSLESSKTIMVGENVTLIPILTPSNASSNFSWSIINYSEQGVASVNGSGRVSGYKSGTVTVQVATENNLTATCKIIVKDPNEVTSISLPTNQSVGVGNSITLQPVIVPSSISPTLTWISDDTSVVSVSAGKITGKKIGTANVTVKTTNGLSAKCKITVTNQISEEALKSAYTRVKNLINKSLKYKK